MVNAPPAARHRRIFAKFSVLLARFLRFENTIKYIRNSSVNGKRARPAGTGIVKPAISGVTSAAYRH
jgi:hypothetical protein